MSEFTGDQKKELRRKIDFLENVNGETDYEGSERVDFLRRIVPVLFEPGGAPTQAQIDLTPSGDRLRKDLAYLDENFAGAGFWPVPMHGVGNGDAVNFEITREFFPPYLPKSGSGAANDTAGAKALADNPNPGLKVFDFPVAPHRPVCATWVRLSWQFGIVLFLTAVYFWRNGASEAIRRVAFAVTLTLGVVMFWLGFLLLNWDPALHELSVGNALLLGVLAALGIFLFVLNLIPKVKDP
jgi:hypothetical protein